MHCKQDVMPYKGRSDQLLNAQLGYKNYSDIMNVIGYPHIRNLITTKLSRASSFQYGELLLAIDHKNRRKLFKLSKNGQLERHVGRIHHDVIAGHQPSDTFKTDTGLRLTLKRPSLEEFVLLTRRNANIMYPNDVWALIGMMDIGPGSKVMEAGAGSGSLTLHLSRAVGSSGRVISFEVRKDHLDNAMANCIEWDNCLRYRGDNGLIDNIEFHNRDINDATDMISDKVDAVALDLVDPTKVLETVSGIVKPMGVVVVYLPNISQAIDLSRHIMSACLPLSWVAVQEVIHRHWSVYPRSHKKGTMESSMFVTTTDNTSALKGYVEPQPGHDDSTALQQPLDHVEHFIARPSHMQEPHTGFLIKLRKSR